MKRHPGRAVSDEHLIRRELYNPNNFTLHFQRQTKYDPHIRGNRIEIGPLAFVLPAGGFIVVPHFYWIVTTGNGSPTYDLVQNFGDMIGKGNRLPSRLEGKRH